MWCDSVCQQDWVLLEQDVRASLLITAQHHIHFLFPFQPRGLGLHCPNTLFCWECLTEGFLQQQQGETRCSKVPALLGAACRSKYSEWCCACCSSAPSGLASAQQRQRWWDLGKMQDHGWVPWQQDSRDNLFLTSSSLPWECFILIVVDNLWQRAGVWARPRGAGLSPAHRWGTGNSGLQRGWQLQQEWDRQRHGGGRQEEGAQCSTHATARVVFAFWCVCFPELCAVCSFHPR